MITKFRKTLIKYREITKAYSYLDVNKLISLLRYKRPAYSKSEKKFIHKFIDVIPEIHRDQYGNRWVQLGDSPTTLYTAHTDDVSAGSGKRRVQYSEELQRLSVARGEKDCLGADDATGIYILLHLIEHEVPGLYLFCRAEETGGYPSYQFARSNTNLLGNITKVISFDRRGQQDVVTHQSGERCCSDNFAGALSNELHMNHKLCTTGVFTDSYNFMDIVSECTNISVGYENEHTRFEYQELQYLDLLLENLLQVDFEHLPVEQNDKFRQLILF